MIRSKVKEPEGKLNKFGIGFKVGIGFILPAHGNYRISKRAGLNFLFTGIAKAGRCFAAVPYTFIMLILFSVVSAVAFLNFN